MREYGTLDMEVRFRFGRFLIGREIRLGVKRASPRRSRSRARPRRATIYARSIAPPPPPPPPQTAHLAGGSRRALAIFNFLFG
ncbi:hypothetical protein EVAR_80528_1 [Eumeta japonica]|uniref:Uncharacterized protein n=1 Tax=Eumeta variegata TaxID=151549 RepID=A0A4C1TND4_EUMVA|nr:hypothetical protein EVAR_80528_1 [Eumeta japonica]